MTFKNWLLEKHHNLNSEDAIWATIQDLIMYLKIEPDEPDLSAVDFREEIHISGNFSSLTMDCCDFKKGLVLSNIVAKTLSLHSTCIYEKFVMKNVTIFGPLYMPQNVSDLARNPEMIVLENVQFHGQTVFQVS